MIRKGFLAKCGVIGAAIAMTSGASAARADVVTDWNDVYLDTVRAVGGAPCPLARSGAMVHVAMYDALQAIDRRYTPLVVTDVHAGRNTNRKAAMAAAAHRVLVHLYPARTAIYDSALADSLAQIPDGVGENNGVAIGVAVADKIIDKYSADQPALNDVNYTYAGTPGAYAPTFPDFTQPPFNPGWTKCATWCMLSSEQFRAKRGPLGYAKMGNLMKSGRYAAQVKEVMLYGKRTSTIRTADQTEIAWFWANDRNGTYKPPGHLNAITQTVSRDANLNLEQNARLFAMINVAMADAGILAWDQKYATDVDLWRPISAIRNADIDGNPLTKANKNWVPLLEFSPPFPGYVSGHATFGGVWAAVMASFFGTDNIAFDATTDEPIVAHVVRRYESFSSAGYDDAISRIYLGVHLRCDIEDGYAQGYKMGQTMAGTFFQRTCRADLSKDGAVTTADMAVFATLFFAQDIGADFNLDGAVNQEDVADFMEAYSDGCNR